MVVEQDFYFRGHVRASWIFGSPNELSAMIASLLPWTWWISATIRDRLVSTRRTLRWTAIGLTLALEAGAWFWLGSTASRGGAVAAIAAALIWVALRIEPNNLRRQGLTLTARLAVCFSGFWLFSFSDRLGLGYAAGDASIGNRFVLWKAACRLMCLRPISGWGAGESGEAFMQWLQPLDAPQIYKTTVNAFLHFGVERGFLIFGLIVWLAVLPFSMGAFCRLSTGVPARMLATTGIASLSAWAVANVFSTLVFDRRLWVIPGLSVMALSLSLSRGVSRKAFRRGLLAATLSAVAVGVTAAVAGSRRESQSFALSIAWKDRAGVELSQQPDATGPIWGIVPDSSVLGQKYGHEIRRMVEAGPASVRWLALDPRVVELPKTQVAGWILVGDQAAHADQLSNDQRIIFVHPSGLPPAKWHGRGLVIAPGIDQTGARELWAEWATQADMRYAEVKGVGRNAKGAWPAAYLSPVEDFFLKGAQRHD